MNRSELFNYWFALAWPWCKEYNQDCAVILAQAAIETGYGKSGLYTKYKNVSGMKIGSGKGFFKGSVNLTTREVENGKDIYIKDNFRTYTTISQSFKDLCFRHYRFNITLTGAGSRSKYLEQIQKSRYATDPKYITLINQVIKSYNLDQYQTEKTNKAGIPWILGIGLGLGLIYLTD